MFLHMFFLFFLLVLSCFLNIPFFLHQVLDKSVFRFYNGSILEKHELMYSGSTSSHREVFHGIHKTWKFGFKGIENLYGMYGIWKCKKRHAFLDTGRGAFPRDLKRGLELGVNFDTAAGYQSGTSEQYLGTRAERFAKRDEVVVATKIFPAQPAGNCRGVSGKIIF